MLLVPSFPGWRGTNGSRATLQVVVGTVQVAGVLLWGWVWCYMSMAVRGCFLLGKGLKHNDPHTHTQVCMHHAVIKIVVVLTG